MASERASPGRLGRRRGRVPQLQLPLLLLGLLLALTAAAAPAWAFIISSPARGRLATPTRTSPVTSSAGSSASSGRGSRVRLQMIGDFLSAFGSGEPQGIPRSIKDGVNALRFATQRALRDRKSRMEVNLPRGVPLGVEAPNLDPDGDKFVKGDRELARLVVELFKPIIESTVVVFQQEWQARKAATIWGTELVKTTSFEAMGASPVVGSAGKRGGGKKGKKGGFGGSGGGGGGVGAGAIPAGTEVLIVVAPSPAELRAVRRISDELGFDTLIIVLNTPLAQAAPFMDKDDGAALLKAFEPVLYLSPINDNSVKTLDNMLMYRSYPGPWQIALKGALGPPTVLADKEGRFTRDEMLDALQKGADINARPLGEKLMQGLFGGGGK